MYLPRPFALLHYLAKLPILGFMYLAGFFVLLHYLAALPFFSSMYLAGFFSLVQLTFLPGFLISYFLGLRRLIPLLVYSFGLSQLFNYLLVFLLTALGLYNRTVLIAFIILEIILLVFVLARFPFPFFSSARKPARKPARKSLWAKEISPFLAREVESWRLFIKTYRGNFLVMCFLGLALFLVYLSFGELYESKDSTFVFWDALSSWNPWALQWARGEFPQNTGQYPQLIPCNWSIFYVLAQNEEVQFFNKLSMAFFPFYILLFLLDDGIRNLRPASIFGVSFVYALMNFALRDLIVSGHADVPVSFFAFLSIMTLLQFLEADSEDPKRKGIWPRLCLSALFCAGAIVSKQSGLFVLLIFSILAYVSLKKANLAKRPVFVPFSLALLISAVLLLSLPWYIKKEVEIMQKKDSSNIEYVTQKLHKGRNYLERNVRAFSMFSKYFGWEGLFICPALSLMALLHRPSLLLLLFHVIPFIFIWTTFYSYDVRNLALVLPTAGLALGRGLEESRKSLSLLFSNRISRHRPLLVWHVIIVALILVMYSGKRFKNEYILSKQIEKQRFGGWRPSLHYSLYAYLSQKGLGKAKILTNYPLLQGVPGLAEHYVFLPGPRELPALVDLHKPEYILIPNYSQETYSEAARQEKYELLISTKDYKLYRAPKNNDKEIVKDL